MMLENGSVDAVAIDYPVAVYNIGDRKDEFTILDEALNSEHFAVGVAQKRCVRAHSYGEHEHVEGDGLSVGHGGGRSIEARDAPTQPEGDAVLLEVMLHEGGAVVIEDT